MKKTFLLFVIAVWWVPTFAQQKIEVGQAVPAFKLKDVKYFNHTIFDPYQVKGKWIILDFWSKTCVSCVKSFPKLNALQQEFKDDVQFVLIGINDTKYNKNIDVAYERYRKNMGLELAVAFDSLLYKRFGVQTVPAAVIIDPDHKVYSIASSGEINAANIRSLIAGKKIKLKLTGDLAIESASKSWNEAVANDFLQRSVLSDYQGEAQNIAIALDSANNKITLVRANLGDLYKQAYWGESNWGRKEIYFSHWKYPLFEVKNSKDMYNINGDVFYNYSLKKTNAKGSGTALKATMKGDLQNYFGYIVVEENRMMPCWELVATGKAKFRLKSKAKTYSADDFGPAGISNGKGVRVESILMLIEMYNEKERIPFIDHTGIEDKIDISFSAAMTDLKEVSRELAKHGLILQKGTIPMKVLVICDPEKAK